MGPASASSRILVRMHVAYRSIVGKPLPYLHKNARISVNVTSSLNLSDRKLTPGDLLAAL
jgi:hypothetical protein